MSFEWITIDQIKDRIVEGFNDLQDYVTEANEGIIDLAQQKGIYDPSDIPEDIHNILRRYGVVYTVMRLCQDKQSAVNTGLPEQNKYLVKYLDSRKELKELKKQITPEVILNKIDQVRDRAIQTGVLFRS